MDKNELRKHAGLPLLTETARGKDLVSEVNAGTEFIKDIGRAPAGRIADALVKDGSIKKSELEITVETLHVWIDAIKEELGDI